MGLLDGIIIVILTLFAWKGFRNGLVKEVFRIVGLVLAVFLAFQYAEFAASVIDPLLDVPAEVIPYIGFAVLFCVAFFGTQMAVYLLDRLIQLLMLSIPNRIFGLLFGLLKSSLLISIVLIFLSGFGVPNNNTRNSSLLYKPVLIVAPASYDIVARVLPGVKPYKDSVERYLSVPVVKTE